MTPDLAAEIEAAVKPERKRCSCCDSDCNYVQDHLACWRGGERLINGVIYFTEQADGYCPFLE